MLAALVMEWVGLLFVDCMTMIHDYFFGRDIDMYFGSRTDVRDSRIG